ncbi:G-alpha-domain-containing protein [Trametes sanguinea]|nr:G-alpha-domain-containing protein [Trametes sanguinea]
MGVGRAVDEDPLSRLLAPPPNETPEERETRLRLEAEARLRSERIDDQLRAERAALKKNRPVKVLLLGQSESGKSTTLKNFQLAYCQDQWEAERASWRMVIQLNLIRGINSILDLLAEEIAGGPAPALAGDSDVSDDEGMGPSAYPPRTGSMLHFTGKHRLLKLRLAPLRTVQRDLEMRIGIQAGANPFLNDIDRIAVRDYQPTDDDVVRARLRTLGVQEYRIKFNKGPATGSEWYIYDVGGSRTQRIAWYPYFDDCDAIIFLAPVSCFDERLAEDRRINRLEDSYMLWKAVVSSKLLAKTSIILFLNKRDLLEQKLRSGVRIRDHVHSYGDRPNEVEHALKYFQQHFRDILRKNSPEPRPFRSHITSVVDTKATAVTLSVVEEGILRDHLQRADLL